MSSSYSLCRPALVVTLLYFVSGCSQKALLDREVRAGSSEEFMIYRTGLVGEFTPRLLQDFDTAIQELKLDAIAKGVAGAALRDQRIRAAANGKPVHQVLVLGWEARRSRLTNELNEMKERYAHDTKLLARPGSNESTQFLSNVTRNEEDKINQLKSLLGDTEQKLQEWSATKAPSV